jgi:hypothetical protein
MRLFQYWDSGEPPADVAPLIEAVRRDNPKHEHQLFDRRAAAWLIQKHFGERYRRAFDDCAVPAMQADYFRLCALLRHGGIYVDADGHSIQPLASLIAATPHDLMVTLDGYLTTGVMVFRRPGNAFLRATLEFVTDNVEQRRFPNVYICTGPPVCDAVRALADPAWFEAAFAVADDWNRGMRFGRLLDEARSKIDVTPALRDAFRAIRLITVDELAAWVSTKRPAYKSTERDWRRWVGSIYAGQRPATEP